MRDLYILGGITVAAIAIGTLLFFFGPSSLQSDVSTAIQTAQVSTSTVPFTVMAQGTDARSLSERTNYRITNTGDLTALWQMIYGNSGSAIPNIDFTKYEVLAVFDGSHSSSGYGISVESVEDANALRTVVIQHISPGSSCTTTTERTSPFEIVQVPKTSFDLAHQDAMTTSTCPK